MTGCRSSGTLHTIFNQAVSAGVPFAEKSVVWENAPSETVAETTRAGQ